jgi:hypothetical protein
MSGKILEMDRAVTLSDNILDILTQEGYNAKESVPGLMLAAATLVVDTAYPSQALDEAINYLVEEYEAIASEELEMAPQGVPTSEKETSEWVDG